MIYALELEDGTIKVGSTCDMAARMACHRRRFGRFTLIGLWPGNIADEAVFHWEHRHLRVSREIYRFPMDPIMWAIKKLTWMAAVEMHLRAAGRMADSYLKRPKGVLDVFTKL
jgi:hypothetical protein